uniref:15-hydroxyprostaglandin dehydrogenase [NAD(+)] n=1 Tax=Lygus hesperus TaxID=30085 RepID=A0A0K8TA16_LYGHE
MPPPPPAKPAPAPVKASPAKGPPPKGKVPAANISDRFNLNELKTDVTADIEKAIAATKASEISKCVVFVTGGANGLGSEIVKAFAKEGSKVGVLDQDQLKGQELATELCKLHGKASVMFFQCNLTDPKSFEAALKQAKTQLGRLDVLVNNASCWVDNLEQFDKSISLNFKSVVTGSLLALNMMGYKMGGAGGIVINIADTLAYIPAFLTPIYAATKAAVIKFTSDMGLSQHYALNKVGFMSVVPSGFSGSRLFEDPQNKIMVSSKDVMDLFTKSFNTSQAKQTCEQVAQNIVKIVKKGERSGTFLVENGDFKKVDLPTGLRSL